MANLPSILLPTSVLALSGVTTLLAQQPTGQGAPGPQEDALQAQLIARCERALGASDLEGLVVMIQVGDEVLLERGWGRLAGSGLASPSSVFRAEALVEPLTAWTAMHLTEGGSLREGSAIHELLPKDFPEDPWGKEPVTVQQLMNHTSGLIGWGSTQPDADKASVKSLLSRVAELGLGFEPGSCFDYSESNSLVLGAIVEKVSGTSLAAAVQAHVLGRIDLDSTGWLTEGAPKATGDFGASREFAGQLVDGPEGVHPFAENQFCSTVSDLTALARALGQGKIVAPQGLDAMLVKRKLTGGAPIGAGYGLNFASIGEIDGFSIGGCAEGTTVHVAHYMESDVTVTCLAAHPQAMLIPLERDLTRLSLGLALPAGARVLLPSEVAEKVIGRYQVGCSTLEVLAGEDGSLTLASAEASDRQLDYHGALQFVDSADPDARFEFVVPEGAERAMVLRINDHGRYSEAVRFP